MLHEYVELMSINLVLLCYGIMTWEYELANAVPMEFNQVMPPECVLEAHSTFFKPPAMMIVMTLFIIHLFVPRVFTMTFFGGLLSWLELELQAQSPGSAPWVTCRRGREVASGCSCHL